MRLPKEIEQCAAALNPATLQNVHDIVPDSEYTAIQHLFTEKSDAWPQTWRNGLAGEPFTEDERRLVAACCHLATSLMWEQEHYLYQHTATHRNCTFIDTVYNLHVFCDANEHALIEQYAHMFRVIWREGPRNWIIGCEYGFNLDALPPLWRYLSGDECAVTVVLPSSESFPLGALRRLLASALGQKRCTICFTTMQSAIDQIVFSAAASCDLELVELLARYYSLHFTKSVRALRCAVKDAQFAVDAQSRFADFWRNVQQQANEFDLVLQREVSEQMLAHSDVRCESMFNIGYYVNSFRHLTLQNLPQRQLRLTESELSKLQMQLWSVELMLKRVVLRHALPLGGLFGSDLELKAVVECLIPAAILECIGSFASSQVCSCIHNHARKNRKI